MNRVTKQSLVAVTIALCTGTVGQADQDRKGCTLKTLRGSYVFAADGHNIVAGVMQPKAIVEFIDFNGDGTLLVPAATRSVNGAIAQIPPGGGGDYTIDEGCTGTLVFFGGPAFDIFVSPRGDKVWMIQTNPNTVLQGTVTRLPR